MINNLPPTILRIFMKAKSLDGKEDYILEINDKSVIGYGEVNLK